MTEDDAGFHGRFVKLIQNEWGALVVIGAALLLGWGLRGGFGEVMGTPAANRENRVQIQDNSRRIGNLETSLRDILVEIEASNTLSCNRWEAELGSRPQECRMLDNLRQLRRDRGR